MSERRPRRARAAGELEKAHRAIARVLLVVDGDHVAAIERLRRAVDHAHDNARLQWSGLRRSDVRKLAKTSAVLDKREARQAERAGAKRARVDARAAKAAARAEAATARAARKVARDDARLAKSLGKTNKRRRLELERKRRADALDLARDREARLLIEETTARGGFDDHAVDPYAHKLQPCSGKTYEEFRGKATFKDAYDNIAFREGSKAKPSRRRIVAERAKMKRAEWARELAGCAAHLVGVVPSHASEEPTFDPSEFLD